MNLPLAARPSSPGPGGGPDSPDLAVSEAPLCWRATELEGREFRNSGAYVNFLEKPKTGAASKKDDAGAQDCAGKGSISAVA